jgi:hypothetical protein
MSLPEADAMPPLPIAAAAGRIFGFTPPGTPSAAADYAIGCRLRAERGLPGVCSPLHAG